ncbi:MAG TPA: Type 1 glutamine amidotransferase-like domain-containing protein [Paraburkholderia sp.]|nr:Type 1 glutamine amidotransferase-like domain-containing protein [Paraburkholderia sp.]
MRLYLSSFDLGRRTERLVALAGSARRTAIIVNALDHLPEARTGWLEKQTEKLIALGFEVTELDLRNFFGEPDRLAEHLKTIDVVWINGGNAFILRRAMRQSGFDALVTEALKRDEIVYAGFSAAAVIASGSLRGLDIIDDSSLVPPGYEPEVVWEGLGLVPFALAAHFRSDHPESKAVDLEVAFYEENSIPYRTLRDGESLVIEGDEVEIVG